MNPPPPPARRPLVPTFYGPTSQIYELHKCFSNMDISFKFPSAFCVCSHKNLGFSDAAPPQDPLISVGVDQRTCLPSYTGQPTFAFPRLLCFPSGSLGSLTAAMEESSTHQLLGYTPPSPPPPLQSPTSRFSKSISVWRQ